jgi:hypothetical protein
MLHRCLHCLPCGKRAFYTIYTNVNDALLCCRQSQRRLKRRLDAFTNPPGRFVARANFFGPDPLPSFAASMSAIIRSTTDANKQSPHRCGGTIIFHPLPICERSCRNGSSCHQIRASGAFFSMLDGGAPFRRTKLYPYRCTSASVATGGLEANNKHRSKSPPQPRSAPPWRVSFFEHAKHHPKPKRSPATIYGGLRLAGTLVLPHRCSRATCNGELMPPKQRNGSRTATLFKSSHPNTNQPNSHQRAPPRQQSALPIVGRRALKRCEFTT